MQLTDIPAPSSANFSKDTRSTLEKWKIAIETNGGQNLGETVVGVMSVLLVADRTGYAITTGFYSDGDGGGQLFYWDATKAKTDHNGGTVIDPDTTVAPGASGWWTTTSTSGTGCWVNDEKVLNVEVFGGKIGSGTNEFAASAALQALSADGGVLVIGRGRYIFNDVIELKSNVTIKGYGILSALVFEFPAQSDQYYSGIKTDRTVLLENISLLDFKIDYTHANCVSGIMLGGIKNLTIDGLYTEGSATPSTMGMAIGISISQWGIETEIRSENVTVKNCKIDKCNNAGIQFSNVRGGIIANNLITNAHREAIGLEPWETDQTSPDPAEVTDVIVEGNIITISENSNFFGGSNDPAIGAGGAYSGGYCANCTISNNIIIGQEVVPDLNYRAITVIGSSTLYAENITVAGNTLINICGSAISLGVGGLKTRNIQVVNNMIRNCNLGQTLDNGAIALRDVYYCTIADNIINGSDHYWQVDEENWCDNNIILGNKGDDGITGKVNLYGPNSITDKYDYITVGDESVTKSETVQILDSATHTFEASGTINRCFFILLCSIGADGSCVFFGADVKSPTPIFIGANVTVGATEPSLAGSVNIWPSADGTQINVKNLLGSSRKFTLKSLGHDAT